MRQYVQFLANGLVGVDAKTGRFEQPEHGNKSAWPHPVVADGKLYLGDQGVLFCYDVKDPKAGT